MAAWGLLLENEERGVSVQFHPVSLILTDRWDEAPETRLRFAHRFDTLVYSNESQRPTQQASQPTEQRRGMKEGRKEGREGGRKE